jgi:hypothetical protein
LALGSASLPDPDTVSKKVTLSGAAAGSSTFPKGSGVDEAEREGAFQRSTMRPS